MARKWHTLLWVAFCLAIMIPSKLGARKGKTLRNFIQDIHDIKEHKKLVRTKTNVLIIFAKSEKAASKNLDLYGEVADEVRGFGSLAFVDCMVDKKLCKKLRVSPDPLELKHYKDGNFNKNYDRKYTVKSMVNFMKDPTGDMPWEEDATAQDIIHVEDKKGLQKLLSREKQPILLMFYAPWCGFCKQLKPEYAAAASELKGHSVLAGMDVNKPENMDVRMEYNITGFPTIVYFEEGRMKYKYGGENNKDGIVSWMKDPQPAKEPAKEEEWADQESDVVHLTDASFDSYLETHPSVLVMFYAPWCGHCKKMKPEYVDAAAKLKEQNVEGIVAALDATKEKQVAEKFAIKGFPTVKYFKDGKEAFEFQERTADKIVEFMKDPKEPPPPPPPEPAWDEVESDVVHLTEATFKPVLRKKKHALVMFYAPWCGHCKKAKPEFMEAASVYKDDSKVAFSAIDCTVHQSVCSAHEVTGYPTFKYFNYGKNAEKYAGGREKADFVNFMKDPQNPAASQPPPPATPEQQWADVEGADNLNHLTAGNFDEFISKHNSVLVMFYAPWCGHCKAMKPAYGEAATKLLTENIDGVLAAVDATVESSLSEKYNIKAFPTLKYFKNGKMDMEYERGRQTDDIVAFMRDPNASPPPVQPVEEEAPWSAEPSAVNHLTQDSFDKFLREKSDVLVMFYAPWCGHCKAAKPEFTAAADELKEKKDKVLAAVDCTTQRDICTKQQVDGYPTFKYFNKGKFVAPYEGGRTKQDFTEFLLKTQKKKDEL